MTEYIVIIFICFVQSMFGIGVLLFGTPIFLLIGYSFVDTLCILLPLSLLINSLQLIRNLHHISLDIFIKILFISLPIIFIILYSVVKINLDLSFLIGVVLILFSCRFFIPILNETFIKFLQLKYSPFVLLGALHGISNLGGSVLTMLVQSKITDKKALRATIAISYASFAIVQIFALLSANINFDLRLDHLIFAFFVYFLVNKLVFQKINNDFYQKIFNILIFIFGIVLMT